MEKDATPSARVLALLDTSSERTAELASAWALNVDELRARLMSGAAIPTGDLFDVSDIFDVPAAYLACTPGSGRGLSVSLRMGMLAERGAPTAVIEHASLLLDRLRLLDSWQGRLESPIKGMDRAQSKYSKGDGRDTARRLRAVLGLGDTAINDLVGLVEQLGYPVAHRTLPEALHGVNARDEHDAYVDRVIIVNARDYWTRQRYTLGHELCHSLYDDEGQIIVDTVEETDRLEEVRADSFARHLLLPERALQTRFVHAQQQHTPAANLVAQLMVDFGVSRDVVVKALIDDGLVSSNHPSLPHLTALAVVEMMNDAELGAQWRALCHGQHDSSGSPWLVERAIDAHAMGFVHARIVAELLDRDVADVQAELDQLG